MDSRLQDILNRFDNVKPYKQNSWLVRCPAHGDKQSSLQISLDGERVLVNCYAGCNTSEVLSTVGLVFEDLFLGDWKPVKKAKKRSKPKLKEKPDIRYEFTATGSWIHYSYYNADGSLAHQTIRIPGKTTEYKESTGEFIREYKDKQFRQRRPDKNGKKGWTWSLIGIEPVLYNLPAINKADKDQAIFLVEGEKDAENLSLAFKVLTTTPPLGGGKWQPQWTKMLAGRKVYMVPDNDKTGSRSVKLIAPELCKAGCQVKVIWLPETLNDKPVKDVSDWLAAGGTKQQLKEIIEAQSFFAPHVAQCRGENDQPETGQNETISTQPMKMADYLIRKDFMVDEFNTLFRWRQGWYRYTGKHYGEMEPEEFRGTIYRCFNGKYAASGGPIIPDQQLVNKTIDAISGARPDLLIATDARPPLFLCPKDNDPDPKYMLSCRNGILNLLTRELLPHSPRLFTVNSLPYDYDPKAECPTWDAFLESIWDGDAENVLTLHQWLGYCLTADTSQQKILLIQGARRSGKGTIGRIMTALLGEKNVTTPTMDTFSGRFGLSNLLEKTLTIIPDARLDHNTRNAAVVERLLSISGEDKLAVERKTISDLPSVKLDTRIVILTNTLPRLTDESGALASRFIPLSTPISFLGREDTKLDEKLKAELPGILNRALTGLDILRDVGRLHIPTSSQEIIDDFRRFTSPIQAFVEECCKLDSNLNTDKDRLYDVWCDYRKGQGISKHPSKSVFVRDLKAAYPFIKPSRKRVEGERTHFLEGIGLKEGVQLDLNFAQ